MSIFCSSFGDTSTAYTRNQLTAKSQQLGWKFQNNIAETEHETESGVLFTEETPSLYYFSSLTEFFFSKTQNEGDKKVYNENLCGDCQCCQFRAVHENLNQFVWTADQIMQSPPPPQHSTILKESRAIIAFFPSCFKILNDV